MLGNIFRVSFINLPIAFDLYIVFTHIVTLSSISGVIRIITNNLLSFMNFIKLLEYFS